MQFSTSEIPDFYLSIALCRNHVRPAMGCRVQCSRNPRIKPYQVSRLHRYIRQALNPPFRWFSMCHLLVQLRRIVYGSYASCSTSSRSRRKSVLRTLEITLHTLDSPSFEITFIFASEKCFDQLACVEIICQLRDSERCHVVERLQHSSLSWNPSVQKSFRRP